MPASVNSLTASDALIEDESQLESMDARLVDNAQARVTYARLRSY